MNCNVNTTTIWESVPYCRPDEEQCSLEHPVARGLLSHCSPAALCEDGYEKPEIKN